MQTRQAIIANSQGIHCRPSAVIVKEFMGYPGQIWLSNDSGSCDVSSVMQLLSLEMNMGSPVKIEVSGENDPLGAAEVGARDEGVADPGDRQVVQLGQGSLDRVGDRRFTLAHRFDVAESGCEGDHVVGEVEG